MFKALRTGFAVAAMVLACAAPRMALAQQDNTFGTWAMGAPAPGEMLAVHSTLLRTDKILVIGGSSYNCCFTWGKEEARFYDIATGTWSAAMASPAPYGSTFDAFCSGHAHDDTGAVIFQGGLRGYGDQNTHGIAQSARFDPAAGHFTQIPGSTDHWYPTMVAGADGLFNFPGRNTQFGTQTPAGEYVERLSYGGSSWTSTGVTVRTKATYPRVCSLPSGKLFVASPGDADRKNVLFDPANNGVLPAGADIVPESEPTQVHGADSWRGSGALLPLVPSGGAYPHARFAITNGVNAYVKDLSQASPTWSTLGTRPTQFGPTPPQRWFANATFLPTGQLLVTGGVRESEMDMDAVRQAEVYDPETNGWLMTSAATVPRNYHGVALLLPDGRVWTASGSKNHSGSQCGGGPTGADCSASINTEVRVEMFIPWYFGRPDRPVITSCPAEIAPDGSPFSFPVAAGGAAATGRVLLIRAGSVTHAYDSDQRVIQLDLVSTAGQSVTVKGPYTSAAALPGDYMLFALHQIATTGFKRWVPSIGCWTHVARAAHAQGAPIWRYAGTLNTWQKLDNNPHTVAIAAAGTHHDQALYQLHSTGWIWRFTGAPCAGDACPGWQRLDDNPATAAIASAGSSLYQLHNDGGIWRYTGTPCNGDACPGWQQLDNNTATSAIAATGDSLYQLHVDGSIWSSTGAGCSGTACGGWRKLDRNTATTAIVAGGDQLYQLHNDGGIWRYTGAPCVGDACGGWQQLDNNSLTSGLTAAGGQLYQVHVDGSIWNYTGAPCSGAGAAQACGGWRRLDNNPRTVALTASGSQLFQIHNDGQVWSYTGIPCNGDNCGGWAQIDANPHGTSIASGDPITMGSSAALYQLHSDPLYQLHSTGKIWRYTGTECTAASCPGWEMLDDNTATAQIAAAGRQLFQRHTDGSIWRATGAPCTGDACPGWQKLDSNAQTTAIAAGGSQLYQLHHDGSIWRSTGAGCTATACPGWQELDNNPLAVAIEASGNQLFQLHHDGSIWRHTGVPCTGSGAAMTCGGWQKLDNNPQAKQIKTAGNQLYQLHSDGSIWRFTGAACGASCPGWQRLDNNPAARSIQAGANQLYQLHNDGSIWRYTGKPCAGTSCPGWEKLDSNAATAEIAATGNRLYQRHTDGSLWRYSGTACSTTACPGWVKLDNNAASHAMAVGGDN